MKALAFAVCILATITIGDAILMDVLQTFKSKIFDIVELLDFHKMYAECVFEVGLLKIVSPEITFCVAKKKNLIDENNAIMWDESLIYIEKLIRDANKMDEIKDIFNRCKEEGNKFEGSMYEKTFKTLQCGTPMVRYIIQQNLFNL